MKALRYIAIILASTVVIAVIVELRSCGNDSPKAGAVSIPADTNFAPVTHREYRPPSLPTSNRKIDVRLPAGVGERDVKRVISIELLGKPSGRSKKINIVETKRDQVFVERDSSIGAVDVKSVLEPIVALQIELGIGLTIGKDRISPAAVLSPVVWDGWLQAPVCLADLDGIGLGAQCKVYHDIYLGAAHLWRFDQGTQSKLTATFML